MIDKNKDAFLIGLVIGSILFYFASQYPNETQVYITGLGLFGVALAYREYRQKGEQQRVLSVTEQIHFFRIEVLDKYESVVKQIKEDKGEDFNLESLMMNKPINDLSYGYLFLNDCKEVIDRQLALDESDEIKRLVIILINTLEEFSWKVILNETQNEQALRIVYDSYVNIVEMFTYRIAFSRDYTQKQFEGIATLYTIWSKLVSRETVDERISKVVQHTKHSIRNIKNNNL